jgi:predicted RNA-binding protein with PIN domain
VPEVPAEVLRGALELAVEVLRAEQRQPGAAALPSTVRQVLAARRLAAPHLIVVRKVVAGDPALRARVAATADVDLVGAAGLAWLQRGPGWVDAVRAAAEAQQAAEREEARVAELEATARTEERRRKGAEERAERAEARVAGLEAELARERNRRVEAEASGTRHDQLVSSLRAEIDGLLDRVRRAEAAAAEAQERLTAAERAREQAETDVAEVAEVRDRALADRAADEASPVRSRPAMPDEVVDGLWEAAGLVRSLAEALERVVGGLASAGGPAAATTRTSSAEQDRGARGPSRRRPLALPGGVLGDSAAAAAHLLRAPDVELVVDGYNVAKLGWPNLALADQREQCIAATEDVARRFGTRVLVVFDGSDVPGASSTARRLVRVVYSPAGVIADDVIRDEVAAIPVHRPVVVATNDMELASSVRAMGANLISSEQLLEVAGRARR